MVVSMAMLQMYLLLIGSVTLLTVYLDWPLASAALLLLMLILFVKGIPLNLAWNESSFGRLLRSFIYYWGFAIVIYAIHYFRGGLSADDPLLSRVSDAFYLSISNWTTLGAGDLLPPKRLRLIGSLEALTGTLSMALVISLIWLWCEETLVKGRRYVSDIKEAAKAQSQKNVDKDKVD